MCRYFLVSVKIISVLVLLQSRFPVESASDDDAFSVDSGLSQRTKHFSKYSLFVRNYTEHDVHTKSRSYKRRTIKKEAEGYTDGQRLGEMSEDRSKTIEKDTSRVPEADRSRAGKSRHAGETVDTQHHKGKRRHHVKQRKSKSKTKSKRKKLKLDRKSALKHAGGVLEKKIMSRIDDRFPDKTHTTRTAETESVSKHSDDIESLMHVLRKTNKSTQKGKGKKRVNPEENTSRSPVTGSTSTQTTPIADVIKPSPYTNETLTDAKEALIRESLKRMHTELIKLKILRLLRMERPPNVTKPFPKFPRHFLEDPALRDEPLLPEISHQSEPSQVVVFAEKELLACPQKTAKCVSFELDRFSGQRVDSAELWVFKEYDPLDHHNHTLVVYELHEPDKNGQPKLRHVVDALETDIKRGWVKFSIRKTVDFWLDKPHRNYGLQIFCKTCKAGANRLTPIATSDDIRPVLIVRFSKRHRMSRGLPDHCHARNTVCCKERLKVDFRALEWDFIIYPKIIEPSFCRGTCERANSIPSINTHHSHFIKNFVQPEIQSCCAPTKMKHVSMLVMDEKMNIIKQDLELVVGECGCVL